MDNNQLCPNNSNENCINHQLSSSLHSDHLGHQVPILIPDILSIDTDKIPKKEVTAKIPPIEQFKSFENTKSLVFEPEFHGIEFLANFITLPEKVNIIQSKDYKCQYKGCKKSFGQSFSLNSHIKTHTKNQSHTCINCGRMFSRLYDKKRHEMIHWEVRPYACAQCHKTFARKDALKKHVQKNIC